MHRKHAKPMSLRRRVALVAALVLASVGITAVSVSAAQDSEQSYCTGPAPDEAGRVVLDCTIPMPSAITVTSPVPVPSPYPSPSPVPTTVTETTTQFVTVSPSPSPTSSPSSTASPSSTPTPPGPTVPVVHGRDINASNTGPQPGQCAEMRVYTSRQRASVLGSTSCVDLSGGINVDAAITLTSSRIVGEVDAEGPRLTLRWVTIDGGGIGTYAIDQHVDCYRCNISGASDGVRFDGTNIVESYIRVLRTSSADHNDAIQAYRASQGGSILRSNIDTRPVNASISGNGAIFIADGSRGEVVIRDNYLQGGGYTLRLHESATYRVTGNVLSGWQYGPLSTTNAVPGAFLEWANNTTSAGAAVNR